jgi:Icc-related predicted phosphoesterase
MKILAFSDIHENISCVRKLREQEDDCYDVIVVAGDIGSDIADDFFTLVSTFECPVIYVYGNWDNALDYKPQPVFNCWQLHLEILLTSGYFFAGYSGCPTHWGCNPVAAELRNETRNKHKAILEQLEEAKLKAELRISQIDVEHEIAVTDIIEAANGRGYKTKLKSLEAELNREKKIALRVYEKICSSNYYNRYMKDWRIAYPEIEKRNRALLFAEIKKSAIDVERLLLVTHERMYRIHEEIGGIRYHLFGHRHGFKHTTFQGTHFVNVSALDSIRSVLPRKSYTETNSYFDNLLNVNAGTYCVIEIDRKKEVKIFERTLRIDQKQWVLQDTDLTFSGAPWVPEEEKYL